MLDSIIIFGTGKAGQKMYDILKSKYTVIAFVDNNRSRIGTLFNSVKVLHPSDLIQMNYDKIYIGSMFKAEIRWQLLNEYHIPLNKIILNTEEDKVDDTIKYLFVIILFSVYIMRYTLC